MRCILRKETDPAFNLAAEEFVVRNLHEDVFMLWRNDPSVIIGKHQNAFSEINHQFITRQGIAVIRRISGGGAVYHDHGNLNFSFVSHGELNHLVDFPRFTFPIVESLNKLGLKVAIGARNNLFIDGYKISGNAEHVYRNKVLHHGTLLFNTELDVLEKAIKPPLLKYEDKAVKSVRARVANITDFLKKEMDIEALASHLMNDIAKSLPGSFIQNFSRLEIQEIMKLKETKYSNWEWNYGYSPQFTFSTVLKTNNEESHVIIEVKEGIIKDILSVNGNIMTSEGHTLTEQLKGLPLNETVIENKFKNSLPEDDIKYLINALFAGGSAEHLHSVNV